MNTPDTEPTPSLAYRFALWIINWFELPLYTKSDLDDMEQAGFRQGQWSAMPNRKSNGQFKRKS